MPAGSRRPAFSPLVIVVDELRHSSYCYGSDEVSQPFLPSPQAVEKVGKLQLSPLGDSRLLSLPASAALTAEARGLKPNCKRVFPT